MVAPVMLLLGKGGAGERPPERERGRVYACKPHPTSWPVQDPVLSCANLWLMSHAAPAAPSPGCCLGLMRHTAWSSALLTARHGMGLVGPWQRLRVARVTAVLACLGLSYFLLPSGAPDRLTRVRRLGVIDASAMLRATASPPTFTKLLDPCEVSQIETYVAVER